MTAKSNEGGALPRAAEWEPFGLTRGLAEMFGPETMAEMVAESMRVRFQGVEYLLPSGDLDRGGAIATPEQYATGECSFAHLFPDGRILRFGEQIGSRADLEVVAEPARSASGRPSDNEIAAQVRRDNAED